MAHRWPTDDYRWSTYGLFMNTPYIPHTYGVLVSALPFHSLAGSHLAELSSLLQPSRAIYHTSIYPAEVKSMNIDYFPLNGGIADNKTFDYGNANDKIRANLQSSPVQTLYIPVRGIIAYNFPAS